MILLPLEKQFRRRTPCSREVERNGQSAESARQFTRNSARRRSPIWKPGCASCAPSCRAITTSPRPWTTCSRAERICLSNNAAGVMYAASLWVGSRGCLRFGRGGERAAAMSSLIVTATMNDVDPQAWLADVLARIVEHLGQRLDKLQPLIGTPPVASPTLSRAISNLLRACLSPVEHQFPPCYRNGRKNFRSRSSYSNIEGLWRIQRPESALLEANRDNTSDRTRAAALCAVGPITRD